MAINIDLEHHALHTVVYRVGKYLTNPARQEKILFCGGNADIDFWKELAKYESQHQKSKSKNNEAREIEIPLPNDLIQDQEKCKKVVEDIIKATIGTDTPHTYVIHQKAKGKIQDNLHVHIVYSERQRNKDLKPKLYKRDIWYDFENKKMSSKGVGQIIHHKGEIQKDKEGNTLYDSDPFTIKNDYYATKQCTYNFKQQTTNILNSYGYDFKIYNNNDIYLKQKKIYKSYSEEKKKETIEFNNCVKRYNNTAKEYIKIFPNGKNELINEKKNLFIDKKLPLQDKIKSLTDKLYCSIQNIKEKTKEQIQKVAYWWNVAKTNCSKTYDGNLKIKKMLDNFCYAVEIQNGDYEIKAHENPQAIKVGIKENSQIEIYDVREEMSWQKTKTNEKGLLDFFGMGVKSPERAKTPLNLNEYKKKAQEYNSDHIHVLNKPKGRER